MENSNFHNQKNSDYIVRITEVNKDTGEETELMDDRFHTVCMLAEQADNETKMVEVMLNENLMGLASMIAASTKHRMAARLALDVLDSERKRASSVEDMLMDMISEGGLQ